ncbi:hypothetical protein ACQ4LE_006058 [Meloidogyne hapla]|uniref:Uncharacterized protein n=1 Tax=Meloidogyne hapla TaxID=6305 RepID=A0A1I8AXA8_MELHA
MKTLHFPNLFKISLFLLVLSLQFVEIAPSKLIKHAIETVPKVVEALKPNIRIPVLTTQIGKGPKKEDYLQTNPPPVFVPAHPTKNFAKITIP